MNIVVMSPIHQPGRGRASGMNPEISMGMQDAPAALASIIASELRWVHLRGKQPAEVPSTGYGEA